MRTPAAIAGLVMAGLLLSSSVVFARLTEDRITTTILRDGERVCSGSSEGTSCKYLEFGTGEVFENTDTWAFLKFNSSDVHGAIAAGKVCDLRVSGWRLPYLSWYRNIVEANCR